MKQIRVSTVIRMAEHFAFQGTPTYVRLWLLYGDRADFLRPPFSAGRADSHVDRVRALSPVLSGDGVVLPCPPCSSVAAGMFPRRQFAVLGDIFKKRDGLNPVGCLPGDWLYCSAVDDRR
jgi:hypothetical protein